MIVRSWRTLVSDLCATRLLVVGLTFVSLASVPRTANAQATASVPSEATFANLNPTFGAVWDADSNCAQNEGRNEYLSWIHSFYYNGGGWYDQSTAIANAINNTNRRARIATELDKLGMRVAAEWAKPNFCRKISTFGGLSLTSISQIFQSAGAADSGDGTAVESAIHQVKDMLDGANVEEPKQKGNS